MNRRSSKYDLGNDRTSRVLHSLSLIEDALEPLIAHTISPNVQRQTSAKFQPKINVFKLVKSLVDATDAFINCSSDIFKDYTEVNSEILVEIDNLRTKSREYDSSN